ncbi:MAG TPA: neutral/alkaline non-lysosomal ceramidase N-terminal domain-containing protein [Streptosporangiaceae bacterium]
MTTLLAGGATADITPDTGVPMGGYSARQGTATGVHDQLLARTIMFSDGSADLVISVCDLVGVGDQIVRRARQLAESELGIPAGCVLIAATHTHSGPLDVNGAGLTPYAEQVAQGILASIREAAGRREPVTLKAGTVEVTTISQNRRDPDGPIETVATIVVATPAGGGRPVATLVNYACHSTVLEHDNMEFSPDFPGAMARFLEREVGGTAVYLQGAAGNINPVWMRHDFTEVERVGGILGSAATRVVHELQPLGSGQWCINLSWSEDVEKPAAGTLLTAAPLAATQVTVDLPRRPARTQADLEQEISQVEAEQSAAAGDLERHHELTARRNQLRVEWAVAGRLAGLPPRAEVVPIEIQAMRISDECALVSLPGEFFVETGNAIRAAAGLPHVLIAGYANGMIGYVPTKEAFALAGYEVGRADFEPGAEQAITEAAVAAVRSLYGP